MAYLYLYQQRTDGQQCGKSFIPNNKKCLIGQAKHGAEHLAENVASWVSGKAIGGALAGIATSHGVPPEVASLVGETAVQALTATILHARKPEHRSASELTKTFIANATGAFAGKVAHRATHGAIPEESHYAQLIGSTVAGKGAGIIGTTGMYRTLNKQGQVLKRLLDRKRTDDSRGDSATRIGLGSTGLTRAEAEALTDLAMVAYAIANQRKQRL